MTTIQRIAGRLILPDRALAGVVTVEDGYIVGVDPSNPADVPAGRSVLPGLVDVHVHGAVGADFTIADLGAARDAVAHHLRNGTSTVLATVLSSTPSETLRAVTTCAQLYDEGTVAGVHLEGPFLSPRYRGAHDPGRIILPDLDLLETLVVAGRGALRTVTLAPELPGALEVIRRLTEHGVTAAIGHTAATYDQVMAAVDVGASHITHLFNAMRPWHHRDGGAVAGCLTAAARGRATVELIADGIHLDAPTVLTTFAVLGADRITLTSDASSATGQPDGRYQLGAVPIRKRGSSVRVDDGTDGGALAGSAATLLDIVRWAVLTAGVPLLDAIRCAATVPAAHLGLHDRGALQAGKRADLILTDDRLRPLAVMKAGHWI